MSSQDTGHLAEQKRYRPNTKRILLVCLLAFILVAAISWVICNLRIDYATQAILQQQREVEQSWLDKSLDSIRVWRNELVEQARFISSSEMFRLFVVDAKSFTPGEIESLSDPDTLHHADDQLRSMAEQYTYIQDLLRDFTRRRAWNDARIILPDGKPLAEPQFSDPLSEQQIELAKQAAATGRPIFGPIRNGENGLMMDMADPLFEVLGAADPQAIAVLLLTVPMTDPLTTFLAKGSDQAEVLAPRIIFPDGNSYSMVLAHQGKIMLEPAGPVITSMDNLPFGLRPAVDGKGEVYSLGGKPTTLNWLFVLEKSAAEVNELINDQEWQIYSLGGITTIALTMLIVLLWKGYVSRKHEEDAIKFEGLYHTIGNQKMILDSMNASFQAGLALIDAYGRVQISNPAFAEICGEGKDIPDGTPLVETLPDKQAIALLEEVNRVNLAGHSADTEMKLPGKDGERLYRVTLYPYSEQDGGQKFSGCVVVFKDITEFRKRAEEQRKKAEQERLRQEALITAFVRAVESIDPNLVGHSEKMAEVATLLAEELRLTEAEKQTLLLAAKLSQVGKIYVPRDLLLKKGKLTEEEMKEVRRAPEYADRILHDMYFDLPVRETVALIGERVDGSGKPLGLTEKDISLEGKALAVVNAFIGMTSARAWRGDEGMSVEKAIHNLSQSAGFDKKVVEALARLDPARLQDIIQKADAKNRQQNNG